MEKTQSMLPLTDLCDLCTFVQSILCGLVHFNLEEKKFLHLKEIRIESITLEDHSITVGGFFC